jgi:hypothetical protein
VGWTNLDQDRGHWSTVVNKVIELRVSQEAAIFKPLSNCQLNKKALPYGVSRGIS